MGKKNLTALKQISQLRNLAFLDETRTCFVPFFSFDEKLYPGAQNPELNDKPVLVLAISINQTTQYSFVDISKLIEEEEIKDVLELMNEGTMESDETCTTTKPEKS